MRGRPLRSRRKCFNPHPARRLDATSDYLRTETSTQRNFNPHPARRPYATVKFNPKSGWSWMFQPSPSPMAGCHTTPFAAYYATEMFQPSPSPMAACYWIKSAGFTRPPTFQPSPSPKAGCQFLNRQNTMKYTISILTLPYARCQLRLGFIPLSL